MIEIPLALYSTPEFFPNCGRLSAVVDLSCQCQVGSICHYLLVKGVQYGLISQ